MYFVYTALIGAYDVGLIKKSQTKNQEYSKYFKFVCFTDQKRLKSDFWEMVFIQEDQKIFTNNEYDKPRTSYYFKTNPHKVVPSDYNISVWMDSSVWELDLKKLYEYCKKLEESKYSLFIEKHPGRNCIYQELEANCRLNKDDISAMRRHVGIYRQEGMPKNYGMVETGLQFRKHNDKELIEFQDDLWYEMIHKTRRDQLSWTYVAWKRKFKNYWLFTFQQKCELLQFRDHPHRAKHIEKVLLAGPWLGDKYFEPNWANYIRKITEKNPFDTVIIGCRKSSKYLYEDFSDRFIEREPNGKVNFNLLDGKVPYFSIKKTGEKEIDDVNPKTEICQKIKNRIIKNKVFVIGMFKTGTTSLGKALEILGYKTMHGPWWITDDNLKDSFNERPKIWKQYYGKIKEGIKQFDAFQDFPWMYLYKEVYDWCPEAKFIYMTRTPQSIAESERKMWLRSGTAEGDVPDPQIFINRYEKHQKEVYEFFKDKKDRFLEMSIIEDGEGWDKLCKFLTLPHPNVNFPHLNIAQKEKSKQRFKIIVPGGKAEKEIDKCLTSILNQKDVDFEVKVMLDDLGDKNTYEKAKKYETDKRVKVQLNDPKDRRYPVGNIVTGIWGFGDIKDDDIICTVDADDWLAHDYVLKRVEKEYSENPSCLVTHGSWKVHPTQNIPNNSFAYKKEEFEKGVRKCLFHASHLRTFKYKCFKDIPEHYFKDVEGNWYNSAGDTALMFAVLESAGFECVKFIPETLYIYNRDTEYNEDKVQSNTQLINLMDIVNKPPYKKQLRISIIDKTFPHGKTIMNYNFNFDSPIEWVRDNNSLDIICFTDFTLPQVQMFKANKHRMAVLIEPPSIFPQPYKWIEQNHKKFDWVFTFDKKLVKENIYYYPYGGCWIEKHLQGIHEKTKNTSIIVSSMTRTKGHLMRHEVVNKFRNQLDVYGKAYNPIDLKIEALKDYRFQIVIENCQLETYFSEKLVDCFVTGTIPVYWGCKGIKDFFDMDGIITFNSVNELEKLLPTLDASTYFKKIHSVERNFKLAQKYSVTENTLFQLIQEKLCV